MYKHQKPHLERQQPLARQKLGLLEKKKDYVLRAKDFHKKERRIKAMKTKIRSKNQDEFYHGMIKARVSDKGQHIQERTAKYSGDELKLLKQQDLTYIRMHIQLNQKRIDKLSQSGQSEGQHISFVSDQESDQDNDKESDKDFDKDSDQELLDLTVSENKQNKEIIRRQNRLKHLKQVERELETQKLIQQKGRKYKVGEDAKGNAVYKWRKERLK